MGLSASQAREISLTARMNDIEYQGQQINQQRTTLSNQVNALYNSLLDMSVPTPPSTHDYTRVVRTYSMGATQYTIDSVLPDGDNYRITCSYNAVGHYLETPGRIRIQNTGDGYTYTHEGTPYPLASLSSDDIHEALGPDNIEKYITAIRNYFPQYLHEDQTVIENAFMVYLTHENEIPTPHFIEASDLTQIPEGEERFINRYDYISNGTYPAHREFTGCHIRFDELGFISEIDIPYTQNSVDELRTYTITNTTVTDNEAYNDAFNKYEEQKYLYDKKQQEINAKTSIIQAEDKNLELKLTRLDNERNALKTELEAVKKVVQDATESGFKTFSG